MNKEQKIRELTKKYFWEQKKKEINEHFKRNFDHYVGSTLAISIMSQIFWAVDNLNFIAIFGLSIFAFWIGYGLGTLINIITDWVETNWKYAKRKARKEVMKKSKRNAKKKTSGKKV